MRVALCSSHYSRRVGTHVAVKPKGSWPGCRQEPSRLELGSNSPVTSKKASDAAAAWRARSIKASHVALPRVLPRASNMAITPSSQACTSSVVDRTLDTCTPSLRCAPEQSMHMSMPCVREAHSGPLAPQSAQASLPEMRRKRVSTSGLSSASGGDGAVEGVRSANFGGGRAVRATLPRRLCRGLGVSACGSDALPLDLSM